MSPWYDKKPKMREMKGTKRDRDGHRSHFIPEGDQEVVKYHSSYFGIEDFHIVEGHTGHQMVVKVSKQFKDADQLEADDCVVIQPFILEFDDPQTGSPFIVSGKILGYLTRQSTTQLVASNGWPSSVVKFDAIGDYTGVKKLRNELFLFFHSDKDYRDDDQDCEDEEVDDGLLTDEYFQAFKKARFSNYIHVVPQPITNTQSTYSGIQFTAVKDDPGQYDDDDDDEDEEEEELAVTESVSLTGQSDDRTDYDEEELEEEGSEHGEESVTITGHDDDGQRGMLEDREPRAVNDEADVGEEDEEDEYEEGEEQEEEAEGEEDGDHGSEEEGSGDDEEEGEEGQQNLEDQDVEEEEDDEDDDDDDDGEEEEEEEEEVIGEIVVEGGGNEAGSVVVVMNVNNGTHEEIDENGEESEGNSELTEEVKVSEGGDEETDDGSEPPTPPTPSTDLNILPLGGIENGNGTSDESQSQEDQAGNGQSSSSARAQLPANPYPHIGTKKMNLNSEIGGGSGSGSGSCGTEGLSERDLDSDSTSISSLSGPED